MREVVLVIILLALVRSAPTSRSQACNRTISSDDGDGADMLYGSD